MVSSPAAPPSTFQNHNVTLNVLFHPVARRWRGRAAFRNINKEILPMVLWGLCVYVSVLLLFCFFVCVSEDSCPVSGSLSRKHIVCRLPGAFSLPQTPRTTPRSVLRASSWRMALAFVVAICFPLNNNYVTVFVSVCACVCVCVFRCNSNTNQEPASLFFPSWEGLCVCPEGSLPRLATIALALTHGNLLSICESTCVSARAAHIATPSSLPWVDFLKENFLANNMKDTVSECFLCPCC